MSGAEIATFCGAWKKVQEIPTDSSFLTIKEIDDLIKRLEAAGKELDKAVPADIREQFDIDNRFANLSEDEQYEPKERQRDREASAKIDAYVADRCG